jgi:hypothetical protein
MSKTEELKRYIYHFWVYLKSFHYFLMKEYKIEGYPSYNEAGRVFPKSGIANIDGNVYKYHYHGSGCTLTVNDIVVDYDLDILNENKVKISDWKFYRFIDTYSKGTSSVSIDDLDTLFVQLVNEGALEQKDPSRLVFAINEKFFQSNTW